MKSLRIIAVSLFCTMLFSSCQKNYEKLIEGSWQIVAEKSYYVENGERNYFGDERNVVPFFRIQFEDGFYKLLYGYAQGKKNVDKGKYHIDKDMVFIKGAPAHISKMDNKTMVLENSSVHLELDRIDHDSFIMFFKNILCSPFWVRIVACIILLVLSFVLYVLSGKVGEGENNSWWDLKTTLRIISVILWLLMFVILFPSLVIGEPETNDEPVFIENTEATEETDRTDFDVLSAIQEGNARLGDPVEAAKQDAKLLNQSINQPQIDTLSYEESLRYLDSLNKLSRQTKIDTLD